MRLRKCVILACLFLSTNALAQPGPNDVFVRVADTGAALCCIARMPGNHYMVYDAGNWTGGGTLAFSKVQEIIPAQSDIELLVLSHSDSDHLGAVDEICTNYNVKRVLRSGYVRDSGTWTDANDAITDERDHHDCIEINLRTCEFPMGATYRFGDVFMMMVCGFHRPPASWGLSGAEERNAGSIAVRLIYHKSSILFCGDAVGRHIGDPADTCIATEKFMVDNKDVIPIDSDVLIAPHHGADNGSSISFIKAVSPQYVVFSAGHMFEHPRAIAAQRYLNNGVLLVNMFRTDRGDDESEPGEPDLEWTHERQPGHHDPAGDDDVDITITPTGTITVQYRNS